MEEGKKNTKLNKTNIKIIKNKLIKMNKIKNKTK